MELLILGLILWFGGKWLVKQTGPMPHLCGGCAHTYYGDRCPRCCEHGEDRPHCEQCLLEGKRIDATSVVVTGEYEPPVSRWAEPYMEPSNEELFGNA